jgi:hypothetical protein
VRSLKGSTPISIGRIPLQMSSMLAITRDAWLSRLDEGEGWWCTNYRFDSPRELVQHASWETYRATPEERQ